MNAEKIRDVLARMEATLNHIDQMLTEYLNKKEGN